MKDEGVEMRNRAADDGGAELDDRRASVLRV